MYIFKIHGDEYRVRFTYKMLCDGDLLDKVLDVMGTLEGKTLKDILKQMTTTTAELLLAGLQKYHSKEFGYKTDETKQERIDQIIDMFDDYEDESTEEHPQSAFTLFSDLRDELEKNGFLSAMLTATDQMIEAEQTAEQVKAEMENKPVIEKVTKLNTPPTESE